MGKDKKQRDSEAGRNPYSSLYARWPWGSQVLDVVLAKEAWGCKPKNLYPVVLMFVLFFHPVFTEAGLCRFLINKQDCIKKQTNKEKQTDSIINFYSQLEHSQGPELWLATWVKMGKRYFELTSMFAFSFCLFDLLLILWTVFVHFPLDMKPKLVA